MLTILVYSTSREKSLRQLCTAIPRLCENELYIGEGKFDFMRKKAEFLGKKVGIHSVRVYEDRKELVKE